MVPGQVMSGGPAVISIREIAIARYLERPQIVQSENNNQLDVRANEWWGEPLGAMLSRVLAEELAQRLPQSIVLGENGAINSTPNATVEVNIERLDAGAPQTAELLAHTNVSFANSKKRARAENGSPSGAGADADYGRAGRSDEHSHWSTRRQPRCDVEHQRCRFVIRSNR